jgi:hypothetical protein
LVISTSNSLPLVGEDRKAFGARRFAFPALAAMSTFSDFASSFETPAASSDRSAFPGEHLTRLRHLLRERNFGVDLYEIMDKRHPSHARNIDG